MEEVSEEKYLGDILSVDGRNSKNIMARKNKSIGSTNQIMGILGNITLKWQKYSEVHYF